MTDTTESTIFKLLETRFESLKSDFARLDADADQAIVRWRYAVDSAFELQADSFRRSNQKPGTLVDTEPVSEYMYHAYGYDAQERIIYAAFFQTEELPRLARFYTHHDDSIELAEYMVELYSENYTLTKVARLTRQGEKPLHYAEYTRTEGQAVQMFEVYHHDAQGRMERIAITNASQTKPPSEAAKKRMQDALEQQRKMAQIFGTEAQFEQWSNTFGGMVQGVFNHQELRTQHEERYEYEGDTLKRITTHHPNLPDYTRYQASPPGETEEALFETARASLRRIVISELQKSENIVNQRLFNLVLSYDAVADDGFMLQLGTEAQRQKWKQTTQERSYESLVMEGLGIQANYVEIWNWPDEVQRLIQSYRRDKRWDDIRKLFVYVARDLNDYNWTGIVDISEDFIVYANDYEAMDDLYNEIRECVPEEKLNILRAKGLRFD